MLDNDVCLFSLCSRDLAETNEALDIGATTHCYSSRHRCRMSSIPRRPRWTVNATIYRSTQRFGKLASSITSFAPASEYVPVIHRSASVLIQRPIVFYFHNLFNLDEEIVAELMEAVCGLLRDPKVRPSSSLT